ncbi:MAG: SPOR domain-containing protein [Granulosicoccus sp.]
MSRDSFEEDNSSRLRQRLWGAAVLIAIAVIVLPLLLDGAGSESQFRRVERLREEPPAILDIDGTRSIQVVPEMRTVEEIVELTENVDEAVVTGTQTSTVPNTPPSSTAGVEREISEEPPTSPQPSLTAWVVQAASFVEEVDALSLRDRLRSAGFASFVRDRDASTDPFRVLVGPMIKQESAEKARKSVAALLQNNPLIMSYP